MNGFYYLESFPTLIGKIEKVLNKYIFFFKQQLPKNKIVEDKMLAPTLCEALNKEGGFKGTWKVGDTEGLATYLVYEHSSRSKFPDFPIYANEHTKCEKPYFLINEIDNGEYKISLEY